VQFLLQHPAAAVHILTILGARQRELLEKLRGIRNVNEAVLKRQTRLQRAVSHLAGIFASERFLLCNLVFITAWVVVHSLIWHDKIKWRDEPPTFFWLGFIITAESIVVAMFVLNSQRRQAERDRVRGDLEYQVNVKAHVEVMELHRKVDRLLEAGNLKK
jgi:CRP/FNR family cyclic AMP-dependent transcriptional regulator